MCIRDRSSNDIEEFALLNNLKLDTRNNVYGMFNDYPVVVMFGSANNCLLYTSRSFWEYDKRNMYC